MWVFCVKLRLLMSSLTIKLNVFDYDIIIKRFWINLVPFWIKSTFFFYYSYYMPCWLIYIIYETIALFNWIWYKISKGNYMYVMKMGSYLFYMFQIHSILSVATLSRATPSMSLTILWSFESNRVWLVKIRLAPNKAVWHWRLVLLDSIVQICLQIEM